MDIPKVKGWGLLQRFVEINSLLILGVIFVLMFFITKQLVANQDAINEMREEVIEHEEIRGHLGMAGEMDDVRATVNSLAEQVLLSMEIQNENFITTSKQIASIARQQAIDTAFSQRREVVNLIAEIEREIDGITANGNHPPASFYSALDNYKNQLAEIDMHIDSIEDNGAMYYR